jgi:hypothetical protein
MPVVTQSLGMNQTQQPQGPWCKYAQIKEKRI